MNIGMISKPAHAKAHLTALQQAGHQVSLLGAGPSINFQPSLDVIVVRQDSCSHAAYDVAMQERRKKGGRPVIVANGVLDIVAQVKKLEEKQKSGKKEKADQTIEGWITTLSELFGVYGPKLHHPKAESLVASLVPKDGVDEAMKVWKESISACKVQSLGAVLGAKWKGKDSLRSLYFIHGSKLSVSATRFAVLNEDVFQKVKVGLGFFDTYKEAKAEADVLRVERNAGKKKKIRASKKPSVSKVPSVPKVPKVPVARVVAVSSDDAEGALKSALGLLLSEMRSLGIPKIVLRSDGVADYERTVVVKRSISIVE